MNRRRFMAGTTLAAVGVLAGGVPAAQAADHAKAMAASKMKIRRLGEHLKASRWTDMAMKDRLAGEARIYARHHRALARLEGRA